MCAQEVHGTVRQEGKHEELLVCAGDRAVSPRDFTLIITFSRLYCVSHFFDAFHMARIDGSICHLLVIDNSSDVRLSRALKTRCEIYAGAFKSVRLVKTWRQGGLENIAKVNPEGVDGFKKSKIPYIFEMHKDIVRLCETERFVLIEDDTIPPWKTRPYLVHDLLALLEKYPRAGIATAIETGRSMITWLSVRLGVHYLYRPGRKILWRLSPGPNLRGLHVVDACGWYCCASYKSLWSLSLTDMDSYVEEVPRFALDVVHTNNISRRGRFIIADFSAWCEHLQSTSDGVYRYGRKQAVPMVDVWLPEWNDYAQALALKQPGHPERIAALVKSRDRELY